MATVATYVYSRLCNVLCMILLTLFTSHIVQCSCMNCIITDGCVMVATLFLSLPIMILIPKPCILVLIEGHYQHFKADNNSFSKCKNGLCDI